MVWVDYLGLPSIRLPMEKSVKIRATYSWQAKSRGNRTIFYEVLMASRTYYSTPSNDNLKCEVYSASTGGGIVRQIEYRLAEPSTSLP